MKKLSLILALIFVLTCSVFVACTEETETSSEAAAESSAAESATESEAVSEAVSVAESEAESEVESEAVSEDVSVPESGSDNLALGKAYTTSDLFRQGGAPDWGWNADADITYPDEDGKSLTDGVYAPADAGYGSVEWAGFNGSHPDYAGYHWITIDLGESTDLAKFVLAHGTQALESGIKAPTKVEVLVSDDGETWTSIGEATPADDASVSEEKTVIEAGASGQYVQFRFEAGGWCFVSEIEIYAAAE